MVRLRDHVTVVEYRYQRASHVLRCYMHTLTLLLVMIFIDCIVWFEDRLAYPVKSPEDGEEAGRSGKNNTGIPDGNSESNACIFRGTRVQRPLFSAASSAPITVTIPDLEWELRDMIGTF